MMPAENDPRFAVLELFRLKPHAFTGWPTRKGPCIVCDRQRTCVVHDADLRTDLRPAQAAALACGPNASVALRAEASVKDDGKHGPQPWEAAVFAVILFGFCYGSILAYQLLISAWSRP